MVLLSFRLRRVAAFRWVILGFRPKEYNEGGCSDTRLRTEAMIWALKDLRLV